MTESLWPDSVSVADATSIATTLTDALIERLLLGDEVDHLAADHAGGPSGPGQGADQFGADRGVAMRIRIREDLEGHG